MQIFKSWAWALSKREGMLFSAFSMRVKLPSHLYQFYAVRHFTPQSEDILASKRFKIKLHRKTPIAAQRHGFVRYGVLAGA